MRKWVSVFVILLALILGVILVVWDYKWNVGSPESWRYKTGMYISYYWSRYVDKNMFFFDPFMPRVRVTQDSQKFDVVSMAKIVKIVSEGTVKANIVVKTGRGQVFGLNVGTATIFNIDPFYNEFVKDVFSYRDAHRRLKVGMYIRFYVSSQKNGTRLVAEDGRFTGEIADLSPYKVTLLKSP